MVSKNSAPHSIRFRNDLWARVLDHAKARGFTPNEAVVELVEAGLGGQGAKVVPPKPAKAGKVKAPKAEPVPPAPKVLKPPPEPKFKPREDTYPDWMRKKG